RLHLSVWRLQASLEQINLDDGKTVSAHADRVFVALPWNALRGDVVKIKRLDLEGLAITLHAANAAAAQESKRKLEIPRIAFDSLAIRNGSLTYSDPSTAVNIPSFNLDIENGHGSVLIGAPIRISPDVQVGVPSVTLQVSDHDVAFGAAKWDLDHPNVM